MNKPKLRTVRQIEAKSKLVINGRPYVVNSSIVAYEDVLDLIGSPRKLLTVTIHTVGDRGRILDPGQSITVVPDMVINVFDNNKS